MNQSLSDGASPPYADSLDQTDRRILTLLARNARMSARAIARELDVSAGLVLDRIQRLEKQGVILGYRVEVDHQAAGFGVNAFAWVKTDLSVDVQEALDFCMTIPEVEVVNWITGELPLFLTIRLRDHAHLQETMLNRLRKIPGATSIDVAIGLAHRRRVGGQYAFIWKQDLGDRQDD